MTEKLITYKGFDADMRCREFQYAIGGTYEHIRAAKVGDNGIKPDTWYSLGADGEFVEVQS